MKKLLSPFYLFLAALIWGLSFSAQKSASALPVFVVNAARGWIAGVFLFLMIPLFDRLTKNERRLISREKPLDFTRSELIGGILCGLMLCAANAVQQFGISGTSFFEGASAGKASFLSALYIVIIPLLSIFLRKPAGIRIWFSVGLAVLGSFLLCFHSESGIGIADLILLLCALLYAFHIMAVGHFSPSVDGVRLSCIQFFTAGTLSALLALCTGSAFTAEALSATVFPLLVLGIGASGIGYTAQILGQKDTAPAVASLILSLESVFGVLGAAVFLHEQMSLREGIGCAIVFLAVLLAQIDPLPLLQRVKERLKAKK